MCVTRGRGFIGLLLIRSFVGCADHVERSEARFLDFSRASMTLNTSSKLLHYPWLNLRSLKDSENTKIFSFPSFGCLSSHFTRHLLRHSQAVLRQQTLVECH